MSDTQAEQQNAEAKVDAPEAKDAAEAAPQAEAKQNAPETKAPERKGGRFGGRQGGPGQRQGGPGQRQGGPRQGQPQGDAESDEPEFIEKVLTINRVAKVTKGGKKLSFSALVVVGDGKGKVGWALGKANEVADAIRKGLTQAKNTMFEVPMSEGTIAHEIMGEFSASKILMKPAAPGTGVIAGGSVRAVCDAAGIQDILAKSLGSGNQMNVVRATIEGLKALEDPQARIQLRKETQGALS